MIETVIEPAMDIQPAQPTKLKTDNRGFSFYRQAVAKNLSPEVFKPNPMRMGWYLGCIALALTAFSFIAFADLAWPLKLLCGIGIGLANGTLGFLTHEIMHGSVVKNKTAQRVLGYFGFFPFFIAPTFWHFSHNMAHHGKSQKLIEDPDAFPNLRIYKHSKYLQAMFRFTPGSGYMRSYLYLGFWLSTHYFASQIYLRFRNGVYASMNHRRVTYEFASQLALGAALLAIAGPTNWLWVFVIPFAIQNYMLMSYIATNHNLSPLTSENNPLVNSLTVTNHPVIEFFNMNFGYHVEHHLFPTVNGKHAKAIHQELARQFPEDLKVMPKWDAIRLLYRTPRIYKNSNELIHPETLETHPTI